MTISTAEGEFKTALIPNGNASHMFEVFVHPFTAGETIAQSKLGHLKVNGRFATAEVVDRLGNGDYVVRITLAKSLSQPPRNSSTWRG